MAVLKKLPEQAIISAHKGVVDYYLWKGIPCARMWPHWPKRKPTPAEKANQDKFAYAARSWKDQPEDVKEAYRAMTKGTNFTGRDFYTQYYIRGLHP